MGLEGISMSIVEYKYRVINSYAEVDWTFVYRWQRKVRAHITQRLGREVRAFTSEGAHSSPTRTRKAMIE